MSYQNATSRASSVERVRGTGVPVRGNDIDTDQIIPARFMKEVTFENMGQYAFFDHRSSEDGTPNQHPFNRFEGASILVVNQNFGCGSSREHAPQALMRWGIRGIIGESFAEIFAGNCQSLGIPTVTADSEWVARLQDRIEANPKVPLCIEVEDAVVKVGDEVHDVDIDPTQQEALLRGVWDTTALMESYMDDVYATAQELPYMLNFEQTDTLN